jgi:uncharacterized RDD family membrane protein YckC
MTNILVTRRKDRQLDPELGSAYFDGIIAKRMVAYGLDVVAIMIVVAILWSALAILGLFTLGATWTLLGVPAVVTPLAYHTVLIAGPRAATLGMRAMRVRVLSLAIGSDGAPTLLQAFISTLIFYGSVAATGFTVLAVSLFNQRRRTLHDWLAGTLVVNDLDH